MTPVRSSWIRGVELGEPDASGILGQVSMQLASGKVLGYTSVPESVMRAMLMAHSPGKVWRELMRGKYMERWL